MQITKEALTFDDVSLVPAYSEILPREVRLQTRLARDIYLNVPVLAAAMDTVTEGPHGDRGRPVRWPGRDS